MGQEHGHPSSANKQTGEGMLGVFGSMSRVLRYRYVLEKVASVRFAYYLSPSADAQLVIDVPELSLQGGVTDEELISNVLPAQARG